MRWSLVVLTDRGQVRMERFDSRYARVFDLPGGELLQPLMVDRSTTVFGDLAKAHSTFEALFE
jgi:hypothetical protein